MFARYTSVFSTRLKKSVFITKILLAIKMAKQFEVLFFQFQFSEMIISKYCNYIIGMKSTCPLSRLIFPTSS